MQLPKINMAKDKMGINTKFIIFLTDIFIKNLATQAHMDKIYPCKELTIEH